MEIEDTRSKEERTSSWPAFLAGTVAGVVLGMLYAPASGDENRRKLSHWLREKREQGKEAINSFRKEPAESHSGLERRSYRDSGKEALTSR